MQIQSPQELLAHELTAIQDAESQAMEALKRLEGALPGDRISGLLQQRMQQGKQVLGAVESSLGKLDGRARAEPNAAARGLIQEMEKLIRAVTTPEMKQAVAIGGVQKLEHYCIAAWGTVKAMAQECGEQELATAMQRAVKEGYDWDRQLSEIAESRVNPSALQTGGDGGGEGRQAQQSRGSGSSSNGGDSDLKAREYRDEQGNVHHHTKEYMERRGK